MFKKIFRFFVPQKDSGEKIMFDADRKKFSIGSIILGIILTIFLFWKTQDGLYEVKSFFDRPECPVTCSTLVSADKVGDRFFYNVSYYEENNKTPKVLSNQYPELVGGFLEARKRWDAYYEQQAFIETLEDEKAREESSRNQNQTNYETGLLENISAEPSRVFDTSQQRAFLDGNQGRIDALTQEIAREITVKNDLFEGFKRAYDEFGKTHTIALKAYLVKKHIFDLKVLVAQILLTFPLLILGNVWYRKAEEKNSKYTILPLTLLIVGGITFLQVLMMYAYSWIPLSFFQEFFEWIAALPFGRVIIHYLFVFLGIGLFGALIINLQRKIFSEKRIMIRRLNKKECPHCALPIEFSSEHCSGCGKQNLSTCNSCGKSTFTMLEFCRHCGNTHAEPPKKKK